MFGSDGGMLATCMLVMVDYCGGGGNPPLQFPMTEVSTQNLMLITLQKNFGVVTNVGGL